MSSHTRARRRNVALVVLIGFACMIAGAALFRDPTLVVSAVLMAVGLLLGVGGTFVLRSRTGRAAGHGEDLDERDTELRDAAHYRSYQAFGALMLADLAYGLVVAGHPEAGSLTAAMTATLFLLGTAMPALNLAWTLPDDDPEDFATTPPRAA
ncbi:hypothetical protein NLX83_19650 [Allokutzneria sp. A3M-2-11 16]|uniref:hypothetical protein n=1 Tax=Allokutzneria sp. A3M-2-11 16 TaxID=2962043 RepID=UPI0020B7EA0E|nr:hypothetical protein [Allokutzneria sp. A3M-2-11 16]MCP3801477.1 hypothetical protein [Allokutzneria sp. A3M-2-11 16]